MGILRSKSGAAIAALAAFALWSGPASAVTCVNTTDDAYMNLTTSGSAAVTCWDSGDQAAPGELPVVTGPGGFNDGYLNLPTEQTNLVAKSDNVNTRDFFNIVTGSLTDGFSGTFTVDSSGSLALLFKSGRGQNDPSWWVYSITGLAPGEIISWSISGLGTVNALSHVSAYVPIPAAVWLMASGLVALLGIGRRRRAAGQPVAA
jgi:hypothetical protein